MLVCVLFGTTINKLLGKVLGLRSVPQVGPDVVLHLVRRVHLFQEGRKRWNWQSSEMGGGVSVVSRTPLATSHNKAGLPSRLLAVLRVCSVCSHHCMKVSCWLLDTPWNNLSSFSSSSAFLLARPPRELLTGETHPEDHFSSCWTLREAEAYLRLALPLLLFCALPFLGWGGGCTASLTASSQKPMLALWGSPQTLLESDPQLVEMLVLLEPHTEVLRGVWKRRVSVNVASHQRGCASSPGAYTSGLGRSGVLGLLLLPLLHLLSFLPLDLQQRPGDSGLFCHPPPARGLGLRLLGQMQRLLLLQLQELLLLAPALRGRDTTWLDVVGEHGV